MVVWLQIAERLLQKAAARLVFIFALRHQFIEISSMKYTTIV